MKTEPKKIKQSFSGATCGKKTEQKQSIWTKKTEQNGVFYLQLHKRNKNSFKKFQSVSGALSYKCPGVMEVVVEEVFQQQSTTL